MTEALELVPFVDGPERKIPSIDPANPDIPDASYSYKLTAKIENRLVKLRCEPQGPSHPDKKRLDEGLTIRIFEPTAGKKKTCRVTLELDTSEVTNWEFRVPDSSHPKNDAMTVNDKLVPSGIYKNLDNHNKSKTTISFDALYRNGAKDPRHPFNLYILLNLPGVAEPTVIKIDPDILNPGDHNREPGDGN
ncbi:MAG: hypothetical protein HY243_12555 [Proteobacteria bacterium]|nr:hypothetical protein [Pseudomonadota bacterium]